MNTVAIFGVGLIGGSFALAMRKAGFRGPHHRRQFAPKPSERALDAARSSMKALPAPEAAGPRT